MTTPRFANFYIDNVPCIDPKSMWGGLTQLNWPLHNHTDVNGVYCYRGRRPSEAHLLVPKSYVDSMDASAAHTIRIDHDGGTLSLPGWYLHKCEAASHGDNTNENQIFYMELRDLRQIAENSVCPGSSFGVFQSTFRNVTTSGELPAPAITWAFLIGSLFGLLPNASRPNQIGNPGLAVVPASSPRNIGLEGLSIWHAVCKCLHACGNLARFDQVTQLYHWDGWGLPQNGLSALREAHKDDEIWRGFHKPANGLSVPEKVRIIFPPERDNVRRQSPWGEAYISELSTNISGAIPGTSWGVVDTSKKEITPGHTPSAEPTAANLEQLEGRVLDLERYIKGVLSAFAAPDCRVYNGIKSDFKTGSELSQVFWVNDRRGVYTYTSTYEDPVFDLPGSHPEMNVVQAPYDCVLAYATTGATARGGVELGVGTAKLQKVVDGVISDLRDQQGLLINVEYYNLSTSTVSPGYIALAREMVTGAYFVFWEDCS